MRVSFDLLEARLQALIEGSAARLFPFTEDRPDSFNKDDFGMDSPGQRLISRLIAALRSNVRSRPDGTFLAPNCFHLVVHPSQAQVLGENQVLLNTIARELSHSITGSDLSFPSPPVLKVIANPELDSHEIHVSVSFDLDHLGDTSSLEGKLDDQRSSPSPSGSLIVDGVRLYPIEKAVLNIGRSSHNDLVIEDLRVSRDHAQLRAIHGRYVIFDLDSTGGTYVNGNRVVQSVLSPGDVISLAGVTIIFNQDAWGPEDHPPVSGETVPYTPEEGSSSLGDG